MVKTMKKSTTKKAKKALARSRCLWILTREARYDEIAEMVVRAKNATQAMGLAAFRAGDEGYDAWTDPEKVSCKRLKLEDVIGVELIAYQN